MHATSEGVVSTAAPGLLPGMYGIATLSTGAPQTAFILPATALNDDTLGRFIYVLDKAPPTVRVSPPAQCM